MIKRLTLVIYSMGDGGAERVLSVLANHWVEQGYEITLLLFNAEISSAYKLNSRCHIRALDLQGESDGVLKGLTANWRRISALRKEICLSQPDLVLSFMTETSVLCVLAMIGKSIPVIAYEHSDPFRDPPGRVWRALRRMAYRGAEHVVVLNRHARSYFSQSIQQKTSVIPNPVSSVEGLRNAENQIIAVGRLAKVKRYNVLVEAFTLIHHEYPDWSLIILGDGDQRGSLEKQVAEAGLESKVRLPGWVANPDQFLLNAGLFVLVSEYEGFPMALCEAMAAGTASISVRYHAGIEDIINDEVNGLIIEAGDAKSLSQTMSRLMGDESLRLRLGEAGKQSMQQFDWVNVSKHWDELFEFTLRH